jgi:hypothetical protein
MFKGTLVMPDTTRKYMGLGFYYAKLKQIKNILQLGWPLICS